LSVLLQLSFAEDVQANFPEQVIQPLFTAPDNKRFDHFNLSSPAVKGNHIKES